MYEEQKVMLLWSRHETQLSGERHHPRDSARKWEERMTKDFVVRKHHRMDKHERETALRTADNRTEWITTIHRVVNPRTEDG